MRGGGSRQNCMLLSIHLVNSAEVHANDWKPDLEASLQEKYMTECIRNVHEELKQQVTGHVETAVGLLHQMRFNAAFEMAHLVQQSGRCNGDTSDLGVERFSNMTYCTCIKAAAEIAKSLYLKSQGLVVRSLACCASARELLQKARVAQEVALLRSIDVMEELARLVSAE